MHPDRYYPSLGGSRVWSQTIHLILVSFECGEFHVAIRDLHRTVLDVVVCTAVPFQRGQRTHFAHLDTVHGVPRLLDVAIVVWPLDCGILKGVGDVGLERLFKIGLGGHRTLLVNDGVSLASVLDKVEERRNLCGHRRLGRLQPTEKIGRL